MKSPKKDIDKPLIILIGGGWSSGKSTAAVNLAYNLKVANIIHTDIIRCSCREIISSKHSPSLHLSTYETWKSIGSKCTEHTLSEGFLEQCKILYPLIKRCINEAIDFGKDTIIEGMHLHPFLYKCISKKH